MRLAKNFVFCIAVSAVALWLRAGQADEASISVVAVTADGSGANDAPFILDSEGNVWGFSTPENLDGWIKISGLSHVKQIVPFAALTTDGRVFTWNFTKPLVASPYAQDVTYTKAKQVEGLDNVVFIYGSLHHFLALLPSGHVAEFGQKFTRIQLTKVGGSLIPEIQTRQLSMPEMVTSVSHVISASVGETAETVLSKDGFAYTWGQAALNRNFALDLKDFYSPSNPLKTFVGTDKIEIYVNEDYLISRSSNSTLNYWGFCFDVSPEPGPIFLSGAADNLPGVQKFVMLPSIAEPNIDLLHDGRVAFSIPPGFTDFPFPRCVDKLPDPIQPKPKFVVGLATKIIDVAYPVATLTGKNWVLMVGSDGSLWKVGIDPMGNLGMGPMGKRIGPQKIDLPFK